MSPTTIVVVCGVIGAGAAGLLIAAVRSYHGNDRIDPDKLAQEIEALPPAKK